MRIHRIEIEGFGPFRDRQTIDLDAYAADGIFLIAGRTGAGKSSILDAICFALYGSVPRYEDGDKRLRSDHCRPDDPTEVAVEFTAGARRWRIERSPEFFRPKKRGDGVTPQKAEARMFERAGGEWIGRAARPVDVAQLIDEVIGLTQQQFLQVILLAQGRFARFLLAKNDERQALLRTLFGTKRFEDYTQALEERRKEAAAQVEARSHAVAAELAEAERVAGDLVEPAEAPLALAEGIERLGRTALRARHLAERADADERESARVLSEAETTHAQRTAQREKQRRREAARLALADLEARADDIAAVRAERDAALRAEPVRGAKEAAERALVAVTAAAARLERARDAWGEARPADPAADTAPALDAFVADAQQRIGAWHPLADVEARLDADAAAIASLRAEAERAAARAAELDERATALPLEQKRVQEALDAATALAATVDPLRAAVALLDQQLAAARSLPGLAEAQRSAFQELQHAKRRKDEAEDHLAALQRRRFAGMAGELAAELSDGEPCAVCGSISHPAPASRGDDPVTVDDIDAADAARTTATAAYEAANTALAAADRAHADAQKDAGGRGADEIDAELSSRRAELGAAEAAAESRPALVAERAALDAEAAEHGARREAVVAERTELDARIAAAENDLSRNRATVADARGGAESVAARIRDEERLVALAADYADAQRESARAETTATEAAELLQAAADDAGFPAVDDALSALRDAAAREALDARVREHDAELAGTKATLMDLELEVLPDEPVDVAASAEALAAAKAAWSDAVKTHTQAAQRARALEDAVERITDAHAKIADLAAEAAAIRRLADTVAGRAPNAKRMKLETFVLAAELEEIVTAANVRLAEMSDDRYRLQHSDALAARGAASGLGLEVMDRFTGRARPPHSLSGGETFLASLALALGLAEVVTNRAGGIRLDTLFIDEGFGSLDAETLDVAMRTLDELRQGGRTVGIISHVEAMKEQIPAQLRVEQAPQGWSVVRQDALSPA